MKRIYGTLLSIVAFGCGNAAIDVGVSHDEVTTCQDTSFRIVTFNTQFLPWVVTHEEGPDYPRAIQYANRLLELDAEVIVLNEVFDEEGRNGLYEGLQALYPYRITKVDADGYDLDDSGLMLFSKYPFAELPDSPFIWEESDYWGYNQQQPFDLAYRLFPCAPGTDDCLAAKGAGLVRVIHPCRNRPVNVVFTHMQATEDSEFLITQPEMRAIQMAEIQELIVESLGEEALGFEEIYLVGDLNIDGHLRRETIDGVPEWNYHFDPSQHRGSFFAGTMVDGWAFGMPATDYGRTAGYPHFPYFEETELGERLDYIVHNDPTVFDKRRCMQHMRIAWELQNMANHRPSDHHGLVADFNDDAPYCNPRQAAAIASDVPTAGALVHPGSMQWYRIDDAGTYSILVYGAHTRFDVYESTDLSRPLKPVSPRPGEYGVRYKLQNAPFYIRVKGTNRNVTGSYTIIVHRHEGTSPEDAIALRANEIEGARAPLGQVTGTSEMWFELTGEEATHGRRRYPKATFALEYGWGQPLDMQILVSDASSLVMWSRRANANDGDLASWDRIAVQNALPAGRYFVRVTNVAPHQRFDVLYRTTLTHFSPKRMHCVAQTDDVGDDEMYRQLTVDGAFYRMQKFAEFDTNEPLQLADWHIPTVRFVDSLELIFMEDDDLNADDWFDPLTIRADDPTIVSKTHQADWDQHTGRYWLRYYLGHAPERK